MVWLPYLFPPISRESVSITNGMQNILSQALQQLGYGWDYVEHLGQPTTHGIQYCMKFTQNLAAFNSPTVGYIYGLPCVSRHEARESALVRALHYRDTDRGYTIQDICYWQWRQIRVASGL
jgi:hypothetical protein